MELRLNYNISNTYARIENYNDTATVESQCKYKRIMIRTYIYMRVRI